jgi:transcriptional regulator
MTKGINLKHVDNTGFLHEFMQEEIAKDPNAEQLYMETRAELQIAIMVKELRKSMKLSQADLAKKMGKSQSTIGRIENGSVKPTISMLEQIAAATDTRLEISFV